MHEGLQVPNLPYCSDYPRSCTRLTSVATGELCTQMRRSFEQHVLPRAWPGASESRSSYKVAM